MKNRSQPTIADKNAVYATISEFLCNETVLKDSTIMCGSWPTSYNVQNCSLAVTDGLNIYRIVLLPVDACHRISHAVDSPNHARESCSFIKFPFHFLQMVWNCNKLFFTSGNCSGNLVQHRASSKHWHAKCIANNSLKASCCVKSQCNE